MATKTLECQLIQGQIGRYLNGERFSPSAIVQLEAHVSGCDDCSELVERRRQVLLETLQENGEQPVENKFHEANMPQGSADVITDPHLESHEDRDWDDGPLDMADAPLNLADDPVDSADAPLDLADAPLSIPAVSKQPEMPRNAPSEVHEHRPIFLWVGLILIVLILGYAGRILLKPSSPGAKHGSRVSRPRLSVSVRRGGSFKRATGHTPKHARAALAISHSVISTAGASHSKVAHAASLSPQPKLKQKPVHQAMRLVDLKGTRPSRHASPVHSNAFVKATSHHRYAARSFKRAAPSSSFHSGIRVYDPQGRPIP